MRGSLIFPSVLHGEGDEPLSLALSPPAPRDGGRRDAFRRYVRPLLDEAGGAREHPGVSAEIDATLQRSAGRSEKTPSSKNSA
jgi:hypothetical protein